ncbi:MAG: hypothetical protein N2484_03390 [Clostridia bacterium]|nr:hypothetical protein [Clostridia bacterium]
MEKDMSPVGEMNMPEHMEEQMGEQMMPMDNIPQMQMPAMGMAPQTGMAPQMGMMPQMGTMPQMMPQAPMMCCPYIMNMQCPMMYGQGTMDMNYNMANPYMSSPYMTSPYMSNPYMSNPYAMNPYMYGQGMGMQY